MPQISNRSGETGRILPRHGHTLGRVRSPTYESWSAMIARLSDPEDHPHYVGVTLDPRWKLFDNFLADMGERPDGMTLDRVENHKGYCKDNCRWATPKQQARGRSSNRLLTLNGRTQCLAAWCEELGLSEHVVRNRVRRGWSDERALTSPGRIYGVGVARATSRRGREEVRMRAKEKTDGHVG